MYDVLLKLIIAAALIELGLSFKNFEDCSSRACTDKVQRAAMQVLRIDWKPISVFPEEAEKIRYSSKPKSCP